ncbi:hypothetical protein AAFF_G00391370 [Aldrovandia affinis]|uniref:Uncharacterized protein n=1 Tax=Aldrovandia affinis TaxID=143900 RepID=A0AAD7WL33_9TELE|nr:hypothetical protein AAFF_G00391370 [Aldrovandia affinis]
MFIWYSTLRRGSNSEIRLLWCQPNENALKPSGAAHVNADALSRRDALWCQAAPPSWSELRGGGMCGSRPEAYQGVVVEEQYIVVRWLHPCTIMGSPGLTGHT